MGQLIVASRVHSNGAQPDTLEAAYDNGTWELQQAPHVDRKAGVALLRELLGAQPALFWIALRVFGSGLLHGAAVFAGPFRNVCGSPMRTVAG